MVGIVIVSHSWKVAEGIYDLVMQMASENDHIIAAVRAVWKTALSAPTP